MFARLSAFASWAVVAASLMFWGLRLFAGTTMAPDYTVAVEQDQRGDLAKVFGASAALPAPTPVATTPAPVVPPQASSRFKLVGVAAPKDANAASGLALISIDGKAPRAIGVGRTVDEGWVLQSVSRRGARLRSEGGSETVDLDIPALALPNRGIPGVAPTAPAPGASSPGLPLPVRPPIAPATAVPPSSSVSPGGAPPAVFVPQEELNRARNRAAGGAEE